MSASLGDQLSSSQDKKQVRKRRGNLPYSKMSRVTDSTKSTSATGAVELSDETSHQSQSKSSPISPQSAISPQLDESELLRRPLLSSSSSSSDMNMRGEKTQKKSCVVDLTADSDTEEVPVIDLVSPVVSRKTPRLQRTTSRDAIIVSESDDSDVIIVPSTSSSQQKTSPSQQKATPMTPPRSSHTHPSPSHHSPSSHDISCPICMDTKQTFTDSGRTLVTTKCGHIFCDSCIKQSISLLHKCPTCSKRLTLKQYHRIYI